MDVLGCLFDVLPFLGHVASRISKLLRAGLIPRLTGLALGLFFEETSNLHYVREFLSHATDIDHDTLVKLRQGYISECNSISVAAAILSQVAVTALSLPGISETHWSAQAFFLISLVAGILTVYFCTRIQYTLGRLHNRDDLLNWFTRPPWRKSEQDEIDEVVIQISTHLTKKGIDHGNLLTMQEYMLVNDFLDRLDSLDSLRDPLLTTALLLATPPQLLNQAAMSFLAGLGIYLGCSYTKRLNSGTGKGGGVALLISYIIFTAHRLASYWVPVSINRLRSRRTRNGSRDVNLMRKLIKQTQARYAHAAKHISHQPQSSDQSMGPRRPNEATVGPAIVVDIEMSNLGARQSPQASTASRQVDGDNTSESRTSAAPIPDSEVSTGTSQETTLPDTPILAQGQAQALLIEAIEAQRHTTQAMEALLQLYQNKSIGTPPSTT